MIEAQLARLRNNPALHCSVVHRLTPAAARPRVPPKGYSLPLLLALSRQNVAPQISRPDPAKVIAGDPVFTDWPHEAQDGLYAGIWQARPGTWAVSHAEWEYFHIREGLSLLTDAAGVTTRLTPGTSIISAPALPAPGRC